MSDERGLSPLEKLRAAVDSTAQLIRLKDERIDEFRAQRDELADELRKHEDPTRDLVNANIDATRNMLQKGLVKAKRLILAGKDGLAVETIDAALSFHPMYAEDWSGWPEERAEKRTRSGA